MNNCDMDGHRFQQASTNEYSKRSNSSVIEPRLGYMVFVCAKCGDTKEIIVRDERTVNDKRTA